MFKYLKKINIGLYPKFILVFLIFFLNVNLSYSDFDTQLAFQTFPKENTKNDDFDEDEDEDEDEIYQKREKNKFNIFMKDKSNKKVLNKAKVNNKKSKIKVGVLLPLSGPYSYIGQSLLDTMQMVIYENKNINTELIIEDTKGKPKTAQIGVRKLIESDVEVILGPFFSNSIKEVSKIARYNKIPLITFSNDYKEHNPGTYLMGFQPEKLVETVTEYTIKKNYKRYAALLPDTEYGKRMLYSYRNILRENQISIDKVELYDPKEKDYEKKIQRLVNLEESPKIEKNPETGADPLEFFDPGFDVLLLIESGEPLKELSALLTYYGVDFPKIKLIGTGEWLEKGIGNEPGLVGAWIASPSQNLWKSFEKKFYNIYNYDPIRVSSLAYDSLLSILAISKGKNYDKLNYEDFQNKFGFTGIDGKFRYLSDGSVERNLAILEIGKKDFIIEKTTRKNIF